MQNDYQGKKVNIILDDDPDYHYIGRISLNYSRKKNVYEITIKADCEPYKMKNAKTVYSILGTGHINLPNGRKSVVPTITTVGDTQLMYKGNTFNVSKGQWVIPEIELTSGINLVFILQNFLTLPYYNSSKVLNGIEWTVNSDGTINANGTATANSQFFVSHRSDGRHILGKGDYVVTCLTEIGSRNTFYCQVGRTLNGEISWITDEFGEGSEFTLTDDNVDMHVAITIRSGQTVDNMVFAPMIAGRTIFEYQEGEL